MRSRSGIFGVSSCACSSCCCARAPSVCRASTSVTAMAKRILDGITHLVASRTSDARAGSTRRTYSSSSRASNASRSTILRASHHVDEFSGSWLSSGCKSREATSARRPSSAIISACACAKASGSTSHPSADSRFSTRNCTAAGWSTSISCRTARAVSLCVRRRTASHLVSASTLTSPASRDSNCHRPAILISRRTVRGVIIWPSIGGIRS